MSIDHKFYPHIFEAILASASFSALVRLRATCREVRDRVDRQLVTHIALERASMSGPDRHLALESCVLGNRLYPIPRAGWLQDMADAVRIVDLLDGELPEGDRNSSFCRTRGELCDSSPSHLARYIDIYAEIVCYWHQHSCTPGIRAARSIHFWTPEGPENTDMALRHLAHCSNSAVHVTRRCPDEFYDSLDPVHIPDVIGSLHIVRLGTIRLRAMDPCEMGRALWKHIFHLPGTVVVGTETWRLPVLSNKLEEREAELHTEIAEYGAWSPHVGIMPREWLYWSDSSTDGETGLEAVGDAGDSGEDGGNSAQHNGDGYVDPEEAEMLARATAAAEIYLRDHDCE
ncbi:hypothetical protein CC85DRAFT_283493 [Cutaneotrichosporon oleaginosum]|uniref:Uncharacterized protein n=1 Tax=Cutaneotrichosporon oleaginosum TaxID=879819 RepID=A0A0J1B9N2_9TREE|nr:uncharacterized protein CC85DRAFT_283493 [Cutaneotrichosporon oleaginosum]KLT44554.1 hypothetical protein CC85DRAFT_283493 [Cutaneotrichosporon oleaginosum]